MNNFLDTVSSNSGSWVDSSIVITNTVLVFLAESVVDRLVAGLVIGKLGSIEDEIVEVNVNVETKSAVSVVMLLLKPFEFVKVVVSVESSFSAEIGVDVISKLAVDSLMTNDSFAFDVCVWMFDVHIVPCSSIVLNSVSSYVGLLEMVLKSVTLTVVGSFDVFASSILLVSCSSTVLKSVSSYVGLSIDVESVE